MARRSYHENPNYLYLGGEINNSSLPSDTPFEFDESELWDSSQHAIPETKHYQKTYPLPMKKPSRWNHQSAGSVVDRRSKTVSSLPVNVPDWSKILQGEYKGNRRTDRNDTDDDDEFDEDDRIPPHEYLARTRMASLSVHEGVGRTLKGRDLYRVRNAIWKQTGLELD